ncbi:hypothetical protein [Mycolicibacterium septicum]|uniref:hypothetical protein n=1 Tax=Mycolicibacterium septicum TaxID=98668 RepID=UPI001AFB2BE9|nr:hypothetical protein [Mycolicibacterium septicum]QRY52814.1 hypothetical protein JVX95_05485 [Mycolicibacterium septicum]
MLDLAGGFAPLSIRTWPDTPEEALVRAIGVAMLFGVIILATWWNLWWFNENRPNAYRRRLEKESAEFRARWPEERLTCAPYLELDEEAQRCWLLVLLMEGRNHGPSDSEHASKDIATVRHWITTVVAAMNVAADRDRRAAIEDDRR